MPSHHEITIDGAGLKARRGDLLLDAALSNGIVLPYECRSGHCGTCCVRLISGSVSGGAGAEPGVVHACQCRISGDAVFESLALSNVRTVEGRVTSLLPLARDVVEVGVRIETTIPHHAGQYAQLHFSGSPSRPFSLTHPLRGKPDNRSVWFHVRRMSGGQVSPLLGKRIKLGHRAKITGPYGSAYFRPDAPGRLILVATSTGFAPIWSIAVAALRENRERRMMIIAGGRSIESLYMGPALAQLMNFPNVLVAPICSTPQNVTNLVMCGRPTDYLPRLLPTDHLYACGAPGMVDAVKTIAANSGATCFADPFMTTERSNDEEMVTSRARRLIGDGRLARGLLLSRPRIDRTSMSAGERGG